MQRFLEPREFLSFCVSFGKNETKCVEKTEEKKDYNVTRKRREIATFVGNTKFGPFCIVKTCERNSLVFWSIKKIGFYFNDKLHGENKKIHLFPCGDKYVISSIKTRVYHIGEKVERRKKIIETFNNGDVDENGI
ncbi:hypothetical protein ISTM_231 [Insectomime virus]|uniref:Uncharacterized protein n=1 Tax=Tunisvirus fontaine2 TaxID=1421067 RepID=V9SDK6_9VIRU|nr:hypothetical protein D1R32_gp083 [Tunisvirus fontaine2]AHA46129.1 hypothetical protein ISTM_231 [Insectomime virus]AHC54800.1 hypothetical protein TNS_ORF82 [Tunisvirus fontaine2]